MCRLSKTFAMEYTINRNSEQLTDKDISYNELNNANTEDKELNESSLSTTSTF